ncbi:MAG TPA: site-specific integrase [Ktedonobacteraceae bacterium]|nr:site-specific integrase [Ktedonobacteraceae bacterium]
MDSKSYASDGYEIGCFLLIIVEVAVFVVVVAVLFGSLYLSNGKPLAYWGVAALFRRLKKRTGIDGKRVSAHNCRRYMATTQLADGRSLLDVQRQMGHTTLTMTNHYASLTTEHLRKSHEEDSFGRGYWSE